jgi:hypothetical protein
MTEREDRSAKAARRIGDVWSLTALGLGLLVSAAACAEPEHADGARAAQALLGARPSGADDNDAVRIVAGRPKVHLCTGTLVAPNVVLTARHCILRRASADVPACTAAGEPRDGIGQDMTPIPPADIEVSYGESVDAMTSTTVTSIHVPDALTICKSDVAFLVLESALPVRPARLRFSPPKVGDRFRVRGWGYTNTKAPAVPTERLALDSLPVTETGPGLLPPNTFATQGGTLCFGDSGAGAMDDDAVFGVYSRIEGPSCEASVVRNVFMSITPHETLARRAFDAAGVPFAPGQPPACEGAACAGEADDGAQPPTSEAVCQAAAPGRTSGSGAAMVGATLAMVALGVWRRRFATRRA